MSLRSRIEGFARRPGDSHETAVSKSLILLVALSCSTLGLVWSAIYWLVFGTGLTMALPLAFTVIVGSAIVVSARMKDHRPLVYAQLTCITWITASIQWSIGSGSAAGQVILWSFLGPIGALMFLSFRAALLWMGMFLLIVAVSVGVDPALQGAPLPVPEHWQQIFLAMNLGTASMVVFASASWFMKSLQAALSDLKGAQAQLIGTETQAVVGRLVAGLLHEMNTPLGAIRSSSKSMETALARCGAFVTAHAEAESVEGKRAARSAAAGPKMMGLINTSVGRLDTLVDGLARFVSLDEAEQARIDVRTCLDTAVALLADTLGKGVRVERDYDDPIPDVLCFPAKLSMVFLAVLQNAVRAIAGSGELRLSVSVEGESVVVAIADTGCGIPASQLLTIFEIGFTQTEGRIAMQLGLPTSKLHLREISGDISIESTEGDGTTVRIELPAA